MNIRIKKFSSWDVLNEKRSEGSPVNQVILGKGLGK
jgi:hypothetical protein